jgi:hypothetical protein
MSEYKCTASETATFELIGEITDCLSFRQKQNDNFRCWKIALRGRFNLLSKDKINNGAD